MISNKRGLSTVVTTLIIILLVLVAIGIIWIVVRGVIETGTETADYAVKCLAVDVRANAVSCCLYNGTACNASATFSYCNVTLERKAGGDPIGGVKMVFHNTTTADSSAVLDSVDLGIPNGIDPLTVETTDFINTTLTGTDKLVVTVYFLDESGEDQICSTQNPFSFA